jgi:hypothetical protein|tara:strand:- start:481 stop:804 length:324 start_codon:yes stop_codon:yes gene_type:complete
MKFIEIKKLQENQDVINKLEDKKFDLERALEDARAITKDVKYVDTYISILSRLDTLAEEHGIKIDEYQERKVFEAKNKLESEVYELEEVFKDAIRSVEYKIDELGEE